MNTIWAKQALTDKGWQQNVSVIIDADGRIQSVQAEQAVTGYQVGILLPAPVNAHSHAFQRALAGLTEQRGQNPKDTFWTWRQLMYRFLQQLKPDYVEAITAFVQMQMLESGYACNVEFHYVHHQPDGSPYANLAEMSERIIVAADKSGIGLTLLPVLYQYGGCDQRALTGGQLRFANDPERYARLVETAENAISILSTDSRIGLAAHSLRAVSPESLNALHSLYQDKPIHLHLAEQQAEVDEVKATWGLRPAEWLLKNIDLNKRWCLIHCTQMQPHETTELAQTGAVAGICPITEANLGDGIFDGVNWLQSGGLIAVGSDSNTRIALSEELRVLEYTQRLRDNSRAVLATSEKSSGRRIFDEITLGGAQAAGRDSGRISAASWADLLALNKNAVDLIDRQDDTILDSFIFSGDDQMITDVWAAGRHQVQNGLHSSHDEITNRYLSVMKELKDVL